ncbi:acyl CoA:acetate/3-ketoacid CoA transferase [Sinorhizobium fredii]|uniref:Acetate CoA-transferase YdiF n=1 Tax=Rhizobium fredii TaxID=380 RepID=A0A844A754_RHIFR|nr:acyl CoA:acetate/3-ketoacid CoA transferase [Sinorhizobium fredii]MCG5477101.1 acyl CoA:acetate/3-ketoacid CoA transferase [Sinorhizobium fredii]MQW97667.1 acyl CoA:acetate/3-ketoacid CoA transferase [Sinorhizobium fredii]MQX08763.1 acyl CoA:acetate/3-ketoacid CoA transferase [Sinorhizobium fredii]UTY51006.1 acyl CoA:acetate/3-ketoacid CoA transferase [Sinorhizobium fredii]
MSVSKHISPAQAAAMIPDGAVVSVSSSSGLGCPDLMLKAIGERFDATGHPRGLTTLHPIAAGDMSGIKGVDYIAKKGLLKKIIGGSYPSGPSSAEPPLIWQMIGANEVAAYNIPSGILFDMHREAAAKRPGVMTKIGLDTFVDPSREGCAMNASAAAEPVVKKISFEGEDWLYFKAIAPQVAIIRATTADERGNLTYEHEGAYLGGLDQALAARNNGGIVIAQVKRIAKEGSLKPHDVRVPGVLVDYVVVDPDQKQTTLTPYDPAISGEIFRPLDSFRVPEFNIQKVIARRVAQELEAGSAVNLGFGISANVPRILLEEGLHGAVTWVIEQGAVGGVPLLDFAFGCASNADAFMPSPYQFTYFQGAGFDASLLSFLEIDRTGSVNVSKLSFRPHVTAGAGGFVDITARAKKIVFSGMFNAGAKLAVADGRLVIEKEGKLKKLVNQVEHVTFSGRRAIEQGQDITYVTERCVMKLTPEGIVLTEIAPGVDLQAHILDQSEFPLIVSDKLKVTDAALFHEAPIGLTLPAKPRREIAGGTHG